MFNNMKHIIITDAIVRVVYIIAVTVAAICFNKPSILFFYALLLLMVHSYKSESTKEKTGYQPTTSVKTQPPNVGSGVQPPKK